jgi:MoaA/NifB/PqqE/SkfB family radical SAM enzyme
MIVERKESWGKLVYDTSLHRFSYIHTDEKDAIPYAEQPVVLNVDLTMKCNMSCLHCVAKDFDKIEDLVVSRKLLDWIHKSPFMVVVVTGGEPLLPEFESDLITLLRGTRDKGLIVDTNGTILPSDSLVDAMIDTNTMIRVSWDSTRSYDETYFRRVRLDRRSNESANLEYYHKKLEIIRRLQESGVHIAVQSVVHKRNMISILDMPKALHELSINQWYLQRFIPSYKAIDESYEVSHDDYERICRKLTRKCRGMGIDCITKKDRRHNCVVLLVGNGLLYTQGEKPREKILLGTIDDEIKFFEYVSSADHAERYYG